MAFTVQVRQTVIVSAAIPFSTHRCSVRLVPALHLQRLSHFHIIPCTTVVVGAAAAASLTRTETKQKQTSNKVV